MSMFSDQPSYKKQTVKFLFSFFSILIVVISALTSFSFFFTYFGTLIPSGLLDDKISRIISGFVGVLLFDVASVIWLVTFLYHSETSEQRAISLPLTIITFIGAAASSVAYLVLTSSGDLRVDDATKSTIGIVSLIIVISGIIINFAAAQAHTRYSLDSKEAVRFADRRDLIADTEAEQAAYLDKLVTAQIRDRLTKIAPSLASLQASDIVSKFYDKESIKLKNKPIIQIAAEQGIDKPNIVKRVKKQG